MFDSACLHMLPHQHTSGADSWVTCGKNVMTNLDIKNYNGCQCTTRLGFRFTAVILNDILVVMTVVIGLVI